MSADGTFTIACPTCQARLRLKLQPPFPEGKKVVCPRCQTSIRLSDSMAVTAPATPTGAARPPAQRLPPPDTRDSPRRSERKAGSGTEHQPGPTQAGHNKRVGNEVYPPKGQVASGKGNSAAAVPPRNATPKRRQPPSLDPWEAETEAAERHEDNPWEASDVFGDPELAEGGSSDPWSPPATLPPRRKAVRNASGNRDSASPRGSRRDSPPRIQSLGVFGWLLAGAVGGLIGAVLTTLMGFTHVSFLVGLMALVSGALVGGGVRYAAGDSQGWAPGLTAAAIALVSIMCGKVGAAYINLGDLARDFQTAAIQGDENTTQEQRIAQQTTDPHMIAGLAAEIQNSWLVSGKITEEQIELHAAEQFPEDVEDSDVIAENLDAPDMDSGGEIEFTPVDLGAAASEPETAEEPVRAVPVDPASGYLPEVWQEATHQWESRSAEEKQARTAEMRQEIVANEKAVEELIPTGRFLLAIPLAFINIFRPFSNLLLLFSGIASAFRIGSHLASSD